MIEDFEHIQEFHKQILAKKYPFNRPDLVEAFWDKDVKIVEVIDPFGNRITFTGRS